MKTLVNAFGSCTITVIKKLPFANGGRFTVGVAHVSSAPRVTLILIVWFSSSSLIIVGPPPTILDLLGHSTPFYLR